MSNLNLAVLHGRLTKEIELKKTQSGHSVCSFNLAVNRRKQPGEESPKADFIPCTAWNGQADFLSNYCHKGDLIGVNGRLKTSSYQNQSGQNVWKMEVICDGIELLNHVSRAEKQPGEVSENHNDQPLDAEMSAQAEKRKQAENDPYGGNNLLDAPKKYRFPSQKETDLGQMIDDDLPF